MFRALTECSETTAKPNPEVLAPVSLNVSRAVEKDGAAGASVKEDYPDYELFDDAHYDSMDAVSFQLI